MLTRRRLLAALAALSATACARPSPSASAPEPTPAAFDREVWKDAARGVLRDALVVLHTFDQFTVFRSSSADGATGPVTADPPSSAAWDNASAGLSGLAARANDAYDSVARSDASDATWRDRRALAGELHLLVAVTDALSAYRASVDHLPSGQDASSLLPLLQSAWSLWANAAAQWQVSRYEVLGAAC